MKRISLWPVIIVALITGTFIGVYTGNTEKELDALETEIVEKEVEITELKDQLTQIQMYNEREYYMNQMEDE